MNDTELKFLEKFKTDKNGLIANVANVLCGADDGELYAERSEVESVLFDNGELEAPFFSIQEGFGLRRVEGLRTGYASSSIFSLSEISEKGMDLRGTFPDKGIYVPAKVRPIATLYSQRSPLTKELAEKIALLREIDSYIRAKDKRVQNVSVALVGEMKEVMIVRADGLVVSEVRPLVRMSINAVVEDTASQSFGGRYEYSRLFVPEVWKKFADMALREALLRSEAKLCPAGKMDVILSNGWSGVLLHEAFGHMLEGDFKYKGTSAFADKQGQRIAAKGVTVIDQGDIPDRRGSSSFDDEGTPTQRNVLVDDGILVGYMHDRLSARVLGEKLTGNGRRQSYEHPPLPRMTNTFMEAGKSTRDEIIAATEHGIFVESLGGGMVDITSGKFDFTVGLGWIIENGKLIHPVKGAEITGSGPEALLSVDMIGNDLELDSGTGTCGKNGQGVPVGIGQPTIRILKGGLTVGGTEATQGRRT